MIVHVVIIQQLCLYKISLRLALSLDSFKVKNKTKHSCRFNGLIVLQLPDIKSNMWSLLYSVSLKKKKKKSHKYLESESCGLYRTQVRNLSRKKDKLPMLLFPVHGQDFQDSWKLRPFIKSKYKILYGSVLCQNNFLAFWRNQELSSGCHILIVLMLLSHSDNVKGPWCLRLRRRSRGLQHTSGFSKSILRFLNYI